MQADVIAVILRRGSLHAGQIVPDPYVQPLAYGHPLGGGIGSLIHGDCGRLHPLADLCLRLACKGALDLPPGSGGPAYGDTGLPVGVFPAVADDRLFPDRPAAFCVFSCHCENLLSDLTQQQKKGIILLHCVMVGNCGICASFAVWSVSSTPGGFMLLFGIRCGMLSAGKNYLSALLNSSGQPSHRGQLLAL